MAKAKAVSLTKGVADPLPVPDDLLTAKGVQFNPPPLEIYPQVMGVIADAVANISGDGGLVGLYERSQDGSVHRANAAVVQKLGRDFAVVLWIGKDWNTSGGVSYGAAARWEWGK